MNKNKKKNNIIDFPSKLSSVEKEIEAIIFAAAEPLNIETIQNKISKKADVEKILVKLQKEYAERGINLVCISKMVFQNFSYCFKFNVSRKNEEKTIT